MEKKFLNAVSEKDNEGAKSCASNFISALEKAKKSNLVHANKVSRKKSRCSALLAKQGKARQGKAKQGRAKRATNKKKTQAVIRTPLI